MNTIKIQRKFDNDIALFEGYISTVLTLAGIHKSKIVISILAHSAKYGRLDKEIKEMIAEKCKTNVQVVSNYMTRLNTEKYLDGQKVIKKLMPPKAPFTLQLILNINEEKEGKQA